MKKPKRNAFRVNIPGDTAVYMTLGKEWFKHKHEVLDLSEGGFRYIANAEVEEGKDSRIFLNFPWLPDPMELKINSVRVLKKEIPVERPKSEKEEEEEEEGKEPPEPEMRTIWEVACRFVGLTIGMQDRVFHQVRQMERWHIMSDRARADEMAEASEETSEQPSENQPSTT